MLSSVVTILTVAYRLIRPKLKPDYGSVIRRFVGWFIELVYETKSSLIRESGKSKLHVVSVLDIPTDVFVSFLHHG